MIRIFSEESKIKVQIDFGGVIKNYIITLVSEEGSVINAALRAENLHNNLRTTLEFIRKQSYEEGWSDAKRKRKKQTFFSGWWS